MRGRKATGGKGKLHGCWVAVGKPSAVQHPFRSVPPAKYTNTCHAVTCCRGSSSCSSLLCTLPRSSSARMFVLRAES